MGSKRQNIVDSLGKLDNVTRLSVDPKILEASLTAFRRQFIPQESTLVIRF